MDDNETLDPSLGDGTTSETPPEIATIPADAPEVAPEPEPEPEPHLSPADERIRELAERNRQLEQAMGLLQQHVLGQQHQQAPPAHNPFNDPALPPEWRQSLETTDRYMAPVIQQRVQQMLAPVQQQLAATLAQAEAAVLAQQQPDFATYYAETMQLQAQLSQQLGRHIPMAAAYTLVRGQRAIAGQDRGQQERRATARAKGKTGATAAAPAGAGVNRGTPLTKERIAAMSDREILALADQQTKAHGGG